MSIKNMHYDFKKKINKVDSQKYRNFRVPEIDWVLNEAYGIFIKMFAQPRTASQFGFELGQRTIDDISPLVIENKEIIPTVFDPKSFTVALPPDYRHLLSSKALGTKGNCSNQELSTNFVQHDDRAEESAYDDSNFEWREVNFRFYSGGIRVFTDGTFNVDKFYMDYIKKPEYIHDAESFVGGTYKLPSGLVLTGHVDCTLPETVHNEIVDIAVLITTEELQMPNYQLKLSKLKLAN